MAVIDPGRQLAIVDETDQIPYAELILATGASPRRLDIHGAALALVGALRTIEDARVIRSLFEQQKKVVIVGSGWLGTEMAAAARSHFSGEAGDPASSSLVGIEIRSLISSTYLRRETSGREVSGESQGSVGTPPHGLAR